MESFDETCRKSQEVEARLKKLLEKKGNESLIEQTLKKIQKTQAIINSNKQNLALTSQTYDKLQNKFGQVVDSAAKSVEISSSANVAEPDFVAQHIDAKELVQVLNKREKIVILTGSSFSEKSRLPAYKHQGFWRKEQTEIDIQNADAIDTQVLLTATFFDEYPKLVWNWVSDYNDKKAKSEPTPQHYLLNQIMQRLKHQGKQVLLITQNIDNLHQEAESQSHKKGKNSYTYHIPVFELHGNITKIRCDFCSSQQKELRLQEYSVYQEMVKMQSRLKCSSCFNNLRPHIIFNDQCSSQIYQSSETILRMASQADLFLVLGSNILSGLTNEIILSFLEKDKAVVEINEHCQIRKTKVKWIESSMANTLNVIKSQLIQS